MNWNTATQNLWHTLGALETSCAHDRICTVEAAFACWYEFTLQVRTDDATFYLIGNGASASMASHFAADLSKNGRVRTKVFTDPSEVTAIGNDIGFEQIYALPLSRYGRAGDVLVAVSASGRSPNILAAVKAAKKRGMKVVTLSGFAQDNPLRAAGDLNFYIPADTYGMAETCHAAILHHWMDIITRSAA